MWMWNCKECSKCYRQSPKNDTWGYVCDEAKAQGFTDISIEYWFASDPNRPANWEPFNPGPTNVFSTLCSSCQDMTLEKYFQHLHDIHVRHDYRYHGGAGSNYRLTGRFEEDIFKNYYSCAVCMHEIVISGFDFGDQLYKSFGYITVGASENGSITVCSNCRPKIKVKELGPLIRSWKIKNDQMWKELYPSKF